MRRIIETLAKSLYGRRKAGVIKRGQLFCMCGLIPLYESGILPVFWRG